MNNIGLRFWVESNILVSYMSLFCSRLISVESTWVPLQRTHSCLGCLKQEYPLSLNATVMECRGWLSYSSYCVFFGKILISWSIVAELCTWDNMWIGMALLIKVGIFQDEFDLTGPLFILLPIEPIQFFIIDQIKRRLIVTSLLGRLYCMLHALCIWFVCYS